MTREEFLMAWEGPVAAWAALCDRKCIVTFLAQRSRNQKRIREPQMNADGRECRRKLLLPLGNLFFAFQALPYNREVPLSWIDSCLGVWNRQFPAFLIQMSICGLRKFSW